MGTKPHVSTRNQIREQKFYKEIWGSETCVDLYKVTDVEYLSIVETTQLSS